MKKAIPTHAVKAVITNEHGDISFFNVMDRQGQIRNPTEIYPVVLLKKKERYSPIFFIYDIQ